MFRIAVKRDEIKLGKPLLWPVVGHDGAQRMQAGEVVKAVSEMTRLFAGGLYRFVEQLEEDETLCQTSHYSCGIYKQINTLILRLNDLQLALVQSQPPEAGNEICMQTQILAFIAELQKLCKNDADMALVALHTYRYHRYSQFHALYTTLLLAIVVNQLDFSEQRRSTLLAANLTANVGLLGAIDKLYAQTHEPSSQQQTIIRKHTLKSAKLLRMAGIKDQEWLDLVKQHHERLDGSGYPHGLKDKAILREANLLALVDAYYAMITPRGYCKARCPPDALREIFLQRFTKLDDEYALTLITELGVYPPGCTVRLGNGEIAIVLNRESDPLTPRICIVANPSGSILPRASYHSTDIGRYNIESAIIMKLDFDFAWLCELR